MSENLRGKASLPFKVSLAGDAMGAPPLEGHTRDMRATGLSLVLPDIKVGAHTLVGEDRVLRVVLELPTGAVEMQVVPVRYEQLESDGTAAQNYLVGVRITEISDSDCVRFVKYLRSLR
ncbi:MAG TPA: hypothetical protein VM911_19200 [Pyrinomonadaceae bacterium]|jgi:hypothetical protein|nr:hypothetical protein [Pyrinomonadaceae bacterium]